MPTATLTFQLPEEQAEFELALNGPSFQGILSDFDETLRRELKYNDSLPRTHRKVLEKLRADLHDLAKLYEVSINP